MIRHLFKMVWNRRRANGLVLLELTLSFLVLCGVLTLAGDAIVNWRKPLGFAHENVWWLKVGMSRYRDLDEAGKQQAWSTYEQVHVMLQSLDEIEAASPLPVNIPFTNSMTATTTYIDGVREMVLHNRVLPEAMEVLEFELVAGRWLQEGDADLNWRPVVLNRRYAEALFGEEDPIDREVPLYDYDGSLRPQNESPRRVVGVIANYRMRGELFAERFSQFSHMPAGGEHDPPRDYLVRIRPGVKIDFEEKLVKAFHEAAPDWMVNVTPLSQVRDRTIRENLTPLMIFAAVALFLLLMVGLGLVGVLWQSVTRRTDELGLRRAMGATAGRVRWQVLGELLALTTIAVVVGGAVFLQLPALQIFPWIAFSAYLVALTLALAVIYPFVVLCGLYPSWMATRVQPAEALQYE